MRSGEEEFETFKDPMEVFEPLGNLEETFSTFEGSGEKGLVDYRIEKDVRAFGESRGKGVNLHRTLGTGIYHEACEEGF